MANALFLIPDNGRDDNTVMHIGLDEIQQGPIRIYFDRLLPSGEVVADFTWSLRPDELPETGTYWYRGQLIDRGGPDWACDPSSSYHVAVASERSV